MLRDGRDDDRRSCAFPCVTCAGCGATFTPTHWRQRHCRPSCRVRAHGARRAERDGDRDDDGDRLAGLFE